MESPAVVSAVETKREGEFRGKSTKNVRGLEKVENTPGPTRGILQQGTLGVASLLQFFRVADVFVTCRGSAALSANDFRIFHELLVIVNIRLQVTDVFQITEVLFVLRMRHCYLIGYFSGHMSSSLAISDFLGLHFSMATLCPRTVSLKGTRIFKRPDSSFAFAWSGLTSWARM